MFYRKRLAAFIQIESIAYQIAQHAKRLSQSISHALATQQEISIVIGSEISL
jgi:hypothetical protein